MAKYRYHNMYLHSRQVQKAIIIVAGGAGRRMGSEVPKQFLPLLGVPVLVRTVLAFDAFDKEMPIVLVLPEGGEEIWLQHAGLHGLEKRCLMTIGGSERFFSVRKGLEALTDFEGIIGVHDGVRPLLSADLISRCFDGAEQFGGALPVVKLNDSLRELTNLGSRHVDRNTLRAVQTPQCFLSGWIREAYERPFSEFLTDDASVVEAAGRSVTLVEGELSNIKITSPVDILLAGAILAGQ